MAILRGSSSELNLDSIFRTKTRPKRFITKLKQIEYDKEKIPESQAKLKGSFTFYF